VAFAGPAVVTFIVLCVRNSYVFSQPFHEDGDSAANSILIQQATRFRLLVGNYSRLGFHHPGPALLYVSAIGQTVFYRFLGVAASPYGGQILATFAMNAALLALVVFIFYRRTGSLSAAAVVFGVIAVFVSYHESVDSAWLSQQYFMPFLLFMVAGASVAGADLADLPFFVLAGSLLVHGEVSFIEFVLGGTIVVAAVWGFRRRGGLRGALAAEQARVKVSAVVLALFLVPLVLNVVLHFPGQWGKYGGYILHHSGHHPIGPSLRFVLSFWAHSPLAGLLIAVFGLVGGAVAWREPDRERRRFLVSLFAMGLFMSVLFLVYANRGVDDLSQGYLGIFYMTVPLLVLLTSAAAITTATEGFRTRSTHRLMRGRAVGSRATRKTTSAPLLLVAAVLLIAAWNGPQLTNRYRGRPDLEVAVATVKAAPQRQGRMVAIDFPHSVWPEAVGFMVNASRAGLQSCFVDPSWTFMVTTEHVCRAATLGVTWRIRIDAANGSEPVGAPVIWSDTLNVITESR
jgi:hypothetical protein